MLHLFSEFSLLLPLPCISASKVGISLTMFCGRTLPSWRPLVCVEYRGDDVSQQVLLLLLSIIGKDKNITKQNVIVVFVQALPFDSIDPPTLPAESSLTFVHNRDGRFFFVQALPSTPSIRLQSLFCPSIFLTSAYPSCRVFFVQALPSTPSIRLHHDLHFRTQSRWQSIALCSTTT